MKKTANLILFLFVFITMSTFATAATVGDGTKESPFIIESQEELLLISDFPDCYFELGKDIVLEGNWTPLCTYTEAFSGVFDGKGHTISNLNFTGFENSGLFSENNGTIKNLNIKTCDDCINTSVYCSSDSTVNYGIITGINNGTISDCNISGSLSVKNTCVATSIYYYGTINIGSIAGTNSGTIKNTTSTATISTSSFSINYDGGIVGKNSETGIITCCSYKSTFKNSTQFGGIANRNLGKINNSYFIGSIYSGAGISYIGKGTIENCYSAFTKTSTGNGITYEGTGTNCFYDQTLSGATDTKYGSPKSTLAMKMKRTFTNANWDFENTWGIDSKINDGYPYLLYEYDVSNDTLPYTLNSIKLKNINGEEISKIPEESFYVEINATKNTTEKNNNSLIIALYGNDNSLIDLKYMSGTYYQNQTVSFGTMINKYEKPIKTIKGFVWDNIQGMAPLSNAIEINN